MKVLSRMGAWRAWDGAVEIGVPLVAALIGWFLVLRLLSEPVAGRPASGLEVAVWLGAAVGLTGWLLGRGLHLARRRRPLTASVAGLIVTVALVGLVAWYAPQRFAARCGELGGSVVSTSAVEGESLAAACQARAVPGSAFLPGTLRRSPWSGEVPLTLGAWLGLVGALAPLGWRDRRLRPTPMAGRVLNSLARAPAAGSQSMVEEGGEAVQACAQATVWGETCGQIYPASRRFRPGETCVRCRQVYLRAPREQELPVVSLVSGDVAWLNGVERLEARSWDRGEPYHARDPGGRARWVEIGRITVPDVLTVAQTLALVHERLEVWERDAAEDATGRKAAIRLARARASRVSAWLWLGDARMDQARNTEARLALGPMRISDYTLAATGRKRYLQLDVGLLPLDTWSAWRFVGRDGSREQNQRMVRWVPVAAGGTVWVPRIEGAALQAWLRDARRPEREVADKDGAGEPLPYEGAGALDWVLKEPEREHEPERRAGASVNEWSWFGPEHVELLRNQSLVLCGRSS